LISEEPISKIDLKDALSDISRILSELTRDIAIARAEGKTTEAARLLELKLQYMEEKGRYSARLTLLRRSRYA
jgi:hypothetical protein